MAQTGGQQETAAHGEKLIPGILDAITLNHITTHLPWRDIHKLASVSKGWRHAIQSRQVYDARVRSNSTEPLTFSFHSPIEGIHMISFFSMKDGAWRYKLPSITSEYFDDVVPPSGRTVTLNVRVYVFVGLDCKVCVYDMAGHGRWKQCASLHKPREEFRCGVTDGKIYVFGGAVLHESTHEHGLYNCKEGTWSSVRSLVSLRYDQDVGRGRDRILVGVNNLFDTYPGRGRDVRVNGEKWEVCNPFQSQGLRNETHVQDAGLLEFYNPIKDQWRVVERVGGPNESMFVAMGKFYSINLNGIYAYDFHGNSWTHLHSFSLAAFGPVDNSVELWPVGVLTDDRELLAVLNWPRMNKSSLVLSRGLGSQNEELVWQNAKLSIPFRYPPGLVAYLVSTIER